MEKQITTTEELQVVLDEIKFVNSSLDLKWQFHYLPFKSENINFGWLVWCSFERKDCNTGEVGIGYGRKEIIWINSTISAAVKTAYVLIKLLVEHELMEGFTWRGFRIFNPHNTVEDLAKIESNKL